ncbi:hypothetical protein N7450_006636 [Penicillium hetheringtonii]|uniref:Galactose oxidase/kelch, beta-propeller n=1 Tax=Penicillium hetheringtonii TaxID=911720 RepID=A0AAD6DIG7_9EURO|nr:hypothetical protein N7450_006636 [Penicillium hetheringtonii]
MDRRRVKRRPLVSALLLALLDSAAAIPYTPTSIFLSPQHNDSLVYLLRPSADTRKTQFLSLNISDVNANSPSFTTLLEETPFQSTDQESTFVPAIDNRGIITVYTGDCHSSDGGSLWRFQADNTSSTGNGTWDQLPVSPNDKKTQPNYLAAGFAFATSNTSDSSMFSFGGMCPALNSTDETWVSAANYSQSMVALAPKSKGSAQYEASVTGDRAPPVPEAGMAVVPLLPSFSPTDVQRDFLFVGGHTKQAFLNMSQLAIFSVPQESWSFVNINTEAKLKTELAIREGDSVEPRSGHAAVLSADGKKVYVIGGWVGDTNTPAEPQFAVLELGEGYGGSAEWTWKLPSSMSAKEIGISDGTGLYGHSAVMLPGDVLMIAGGYSISKQSSKRAISAQHNSQVYLYNVTSNTQVKSYSNPAVLKSATTASSSKHGGLSSGQKAGLGVGLGIGIPLAILFAVCAWKYDRKRRVRGKRDSQLRELALGAERAHFWGRDDPHQASSIRSTLMSERYESGAAYGWGGNRSLSSKPSWKTQEQTDQQAEQTELLMDCSPTKSNRPVCQQQRPYRFSGWERRRSEAASDIHPIDEREEDEAIFRERLMATIPAEKPPKIHDPDDPFSDTPFSTPRSTIFGVGLGPFYTRRKDGGSVDDASKSDRTSTNLSDASNFSFSSTKPTGQVNQARGVIVDRPLSWASSGEHSVAAASTHSRETTHSEIDGVNAPSEQSFSTDSYSTAQSTFSHRQAENESLLNDTLETPITPIESSPSKLPATKPRTSDWMFQTVRRALTLSRRTPQDESAPLASGVDRRSTVLIPTSQSGPASGASTPRRAVSASAELFRRKQGARDWNAKKRMSDGVHFSGPRSTRDDLFLGAPGYLGDDDTCDEDWDVEGAAQERNVQMTYTVPREKLRVVNGNANDNLSERSVSRTLSGTRIVSR